MTDTAYIETPTIPAGMTMAEYRRTRTHKRPSLWRRIIGV